MQTAENLVRKQYLISQRQIKKIEMLAKKQKTSAAQLVRDAIDAYNPELSGDMQQSKLLSLVSARVKEAILDTQATRKRLDKTLQILTAKSE